MKTPQRKFVVEYKTSRRQTQARPSSIWGSLDLQAVARQVEADGISADAVRTDPIPVVNDEASVAAISAAPEPQAAIKNDGPIPAGPIADEADAEFLKDRPSERQAIDTPAVGEHRRTASETKRPSLPPTKSKRAASQPKAAAAGRIGIAPQRDDEEDLAVLDAENRRLRSLVIIKLRQENDRLRSMLSRFGAE